MAAREGIGEGISSTENRPHGPSTSTTGKGELAEPRDTPRSRGRLGWDTWREKRAHPYANAAVARTTKQAHAHRQNACSQFLCPSLKDSTPRAVPRSPVFAVVLTKCFSTSTKRLLLPTNIGFRIVRGFQVTRLLQENFNYSRFADKIRRGEQSIHQ